MNNFPIGEWWAVRKEQINTAKDDPKYRYECGVKVYDKWKGNAEFSLVHRFKDGALVLGAKVMTEADKVLKQ